MKSRPDDPDVDVWWAALAADALPFEEAWGLLSSEERAWADRLRDPDDRARRVTTRALLRLVLSQYLGTDAKEIPIGESDEGKPEVTSADRWPRFNVSHSGAMALIAVGGTREVGVDVERVRSDFDWQEVADAFFSPVETTALAQLPPPDAVRTFFDCWVRTEAYLKGQGVGLRRALIDVHVPLGHAGGAVLDDAAPEGGKAWHVYPLDARGGYAAALAVEGTSRITMRRADPSARSR